MPDYCVYDGMKTVCDAVTWEEQRDCQFSRSTGDRCMYYYYSSDDLERCDNPAAQEKARKEHQ